MQSYIKVVLSDDCKTDAESWKEINNPRLIYSQTKSKQCNKYVIFLDFLKKQSKHLIHTICTMKIY